MLESKLSSELESNMDEDFPEELLDTVRNLEKGIDNLGKGFEELLKKNRIEFYENLDPLTRAKIDIVSLYSINSMFWMLMKTLGHNPQASDVKAELGRVRSAITRCKEIQDREKRGKVNQDAARRMVTSGLWKPGEEKIRPETSKEDLARTAEMQEAANPPRKKIRPETSKEDLARTAEMQ